jgi:hypothetical protein
MANWHTPFWLSAICLVTACGPNTPQTDSQTEIGTTAEPTAEQVDNGASQSDPSSKEVPVASQPLKAESEQLQDTTVVPGERVGPVTPDTSRVDLVDLFGEAALEDTEIPVGEGFTESGTKVNPGTEQAFSIIWMDSSQAKPATVKDFGTAWQTPEGIQIGTPMTELTSILGNFDLYGFGWDYGGTIDLESSDLANYYGLLILRLQPVEPAAWQQNADAFQAVQGDKLISSEDPNLSDLNLVVDEMIIYLNPPN